jgi:hypothetical protein
MSSRSVTVGSIIAPLKHLVLFSARKKSIPLVPVLLPATFIFYYPRYSIILVISTLLFRFLYLSRYKEGDTGRGFTARILTWGTRNVGWGFFWGSGMLVVGETVREGLRALVLRWLRYGLLWVEVAEEEQLRKEPWLRATGGKGYVRLILGVSICLICPGPMIEHFSTSIVIASKRLLRATRSSTRQGPKRGVVLEERRDTSNVTPKSFPPPMQETNPSTREHSAGEKLSNILVASPSTRRSPRKRYYISE